MTLFFSDCCHVEVIFGAKPCRVLPVCLFTCCKTMLDAANTTLCVVYHPFGGCRDYFAPGAKPCRKAQNRFAHGAIPFFLSPPAFCIARNIQIPYFTRKS